MMHLFKDNAVFAEFADTASLAIWLIKHPETHDYDRDGLKFREPWRLVQWPT